MKWKDKPLTVTVKDHVLTIQVGIDVVKWAAENMDENNPLDEESNNFKLQWRIRDAKVFAMDVCRAMKDEAEDGSTPLTRLLDKMCLAAIEDGSTATEKFAAERMDGQ